MGSNDEEDSYFLYSNDGDDLEDRIAGIRSGMSRKQAAN
jgi:3-phenylpropionate/cinnamic acid dioxygenase small subunit